MATLATFKDFIKVREYINLKYDYYANFGRMRENLSPEEELEQHACWELIRDLKGFVDNNPCKPEGFVVSYKGSTLKFVDDDFRKANITVVKSWDPIK